MRLRRGSHGVFARNARATYPLIWIILSFIMASLQVYAKEMNDGAELRKQRAEVIRSLNRPQNPTQTPSQQKPIINLPPSIHRASTTPSQIPATTPTSEPRVVEAESKASRVSDGSKRKVASGMSSKARFKGHRVGGRKDSKHRATAKKSPTKVSTQSHKCGFCTHDGLVFCGGQSVRIASLIEQDRKQRKHKHLHRKKRGAKRVHHKTAHRV